MLDDATGGAGGAVSPPPPPAAPPADAWHTGFDAETQAYIQAKKLDGVADWKEAFTNVAKSHRDAESYIGIPADQRLRAPNPNDTASVRAFWAKFGVPEAEAGYDLSEVKRADGNPVDPALVSVVQKAAFQHNVPVAAAQALAKDLVGYLDGQAAEQAEALKPELEAAQGRLKALWGANYQANVGLADQAAKRIGLDVDAAALLAEKVGADKVLEALRKVGAATSEDSFVAGNPMQGATPPMTVVEARETLQQLQADLEFGKRLINGDLAAKKQWDAALAAANPDLIAAAVA